MKKLLLSLVLLSGYHLQAASSDAGQTEEELAAIQKPIQKFNEQEVAMLFNQDNTVTLRFSIEPDQFKDIVIPNSLVEQCELLKNMRELFFGDVTPEPSLLRFTSEGAETFVNLFSDTPTVDQMNETLDRYTLNQLVDLFMAVKILGYEYPDDTIDIINLLQEKVTELFSKMVENNQLIDSITLAKIQASMLRDYLIKELYKRAAWSVLHTLQGHTGLVHSVAFSPDGKFIVTGSGDHTARLWDVQTGQLLLTLQGHTGSVSSVAFSPDRQSVATGSWDRTAKLWDVQKGQCLATLQGGHTDWVTSLAFSPDGQLVVTASLDRTARLWLNSFAKAGINTLEQALEFSIEDVLYVYKNGQKPVSKVPAAESRPE